MSNQANGQELKQYIERIEKLDEERKEIADQIKEVFSELKGNGYDAPAVREILKERKKDPNDIAEQEAIIDLYKSVMGM